jgi:outer membrane usher protein
MKARSLPTTTDGRLGLMLYLRAGLMVLALLPSFLHAQELILATVVINEKPVAELLAYEDAGQLLFDEAALLPVLQPWVSEEVLARLFAGGGGLASSAFAGQGLSASWDPYTLVFSLQVPASLSPVQRFAVARTRPAPNGPVYGPEPFSAILNVAGRAAYTNTAGVSDYPLQLDSNLALNISSWVVELGASGSLEDGLPDFSLTRARLVKDFVPADARFTAGLLDAPASGFQASMPLMGLALQSKIFSLTRRLVNPGMKELLLERGGVLRIFLNGALLRTERLEPGIYQLGDIPVSSGLNRLDLEVEEPGSEPYRIVHVQPHDDSFLGIGGIDYALAFGLVDVEELHPVGTGFLRLSAGERFDYGLSLQAGFGTALVGASVAAATRLGNLAFDAGFSHPTGSEGDPAAYALASRYRLTFPGRSALPALGVAAQYTSHGFSAPRLKLTPEIPASTLRLTTSLSAALPAGISGSFFAENRRNLDTGTQSTTMALTLRRRLAEGLTFSGLGSLVFQPTGELTPILTLSVFSSPPGTGRNFQYSQDLYQSESAFDLSGPAGLGTDVEVAIRGRNILGHSDTPASLGAQSRLRHAYGDFGTSAGWEHDPATGKDSTSLGVSAAGALVYAGGYLRYTRPVPDSFVILDPKDSLGGTAVELQLGSSSAGVRSQDGNPAVGALASYRPVQGFVNLPEASPELTSDKTFVVLSPTYRSGLVVKPDAKPNISAAGYLLDRAGSPVSWIFGTLLDRDGSSLEQGFTDSEGRFELYGLVPGSYTLVWASKPEFSMELVVPDDGSTSIELGRIIIADDAGKGK